MCCPCMFSTNVNLWMLRRTHFSFWFIKPPFRLSLPFSSISRVRTIRITVFDQFGISVYVTHMCSPYQHVPHEHKKPFLLSFWGFRQTGGGVPLNHPFECDFHGCSIVNYPFWVPPWKTAIFTTNHCHSCPRGWGSKYGCPSQSPTPATTAAFGTSCRPMLGGNNKRYDKCITYAYVSVYASVYLCTCICKYYLCIPVWAFDLFLIHETMVNYVFYLSW